MIKLIDNYVIDADARCYTIGTLTKNKNKEDGTITESIQNPGYYTTLQQALNGILKRIERDTTRNTTGDLKALTEAIRASHDRVVEAFNKCFPEYEVIKRPDNTAQK